MTLQDIINIYDEYEIPLDAPNFYIDGNKDWVVALYNYHDEEAAVEINLLVDGDAVTVGCNDVIVGRRTKGQT
jgi:hypothetical protein